MKKLFALSLFALFALPVFAQDPHFTIGANVTVANPQGEFEK